MYAKTHNKYLKVIKCDYVSCSTGWCSYHFLEKRFLHIIRICFMIFAYHLILKHHLDNSWLPTTKIITTFLPTYLVECFNPTLSLYGYCFIASPAIGRLTSKTKAIVKCRLWRKCTMCSCALLPSSRPAQLDTAEQNSRSLRASHTRRERRERTRVSECFQKSNSKFECLFFLRETTSFIMRNLVR